MRVNRLGAVVTGAHGHAGGVQDLPDVMGVNAVDREGDDPEPSARAGRAEHTCSVDGREPVKHLLGERPLPRVRSVHAQAGARQAAAWASGWLPASKRAGPDM